jgi:tetrahydromethanopterin S-methyltransferase subunit F
MSAREQEDTMSAQQPSTVSGTAVGFTVFAAVMMIMIGAFQAIAGFVALVNDTFYVVGEEWVFQFDVTTWGWIHLALGIVIGLAGAALFSGAVWARTVGVIVATVSAVLSFAWLPWYPIWAVLVITADVFVIWALTTHGRDLSRA